MKTLPILALTLLLSPAAVAGEITATVVKGSLVVKGSSGNDGFQIDRLALPEGSLRIVPTFGTMLNGGGEAVFDGITGDLRIDTREGVDEVVLHDLVVPRDLRLKGKDSLEVVMQVSTIVGRDLVAKLGNGDSALLGESLLDVGRHCRVALGHGENDFLCTGSTLIGGKLICKGGSGGDVVSMQVGSVAGTSRLKLGNGSNRFLADAFSSDAGVLVRGGKHDEHVIMSVAAQGGFETRLGRGENYVSFAGSAIFGDLVCRGGKGTDTLLLQSSVVHGRLAVDIAGGSDDVFMHQCAVHGKAVVSLGKGVDTFYAFGSTFTAHAMVFGPAGDNDVGFEASDVGGKLKIKTGPGDDTITVAATSVAGKTKIQPGAGDNVVH